MNATDPEARDLRRGLAEASLAHERWVPVYATKLVSSSLVDLFQCFSQTADFFLDAAQPSATARRTLDRLLAEILAAALSYVRRVQQRCGDAADLMHAPATAEPGGAPRRAAPAGGALPAAVAARYEALPPAAMCTMINNVHSCRPMLAALWEAADRGWARVSGGGGLRAGELEAALPPLARSGRAVAQFAATRLIFYDLRGPLLGTPGSPAISA